MNDLNVIDRFMQAFITYIDAGFGLLGGDVRFLTVTLIGIDITLAGLFWALGGDDNVMGRFIKKILYVGAFAFILNSFSTLSDIIFRSFAQAGLTAGGGSLTAADLLKPGRLAGTGFSAAWPLLEQVSQLMGFTTFFDNFLTIAVLLFAWAIVIITFFILAVQMFVTIIEFKLTSLAGFMLVPFSLWNRTSFLAERVLGNVVSSGIKVMVLAVIVGIGSNFFTEFTAALQGQEPDIGQAMSLMLASLTIFGLGIFGPSIASGLVSWRTPARRGCGARYRPSARQASPCSREALPLAVRARLVVRRLELSGRARRWDRPRRRHTASARKPLRRRPWRLDLAVSPAPQAMPPVSVPPAPSASARPPPKAGPPHGTRSIVPTAVPAPKSAEQRRRSCMGARHARSADRPPSPPDRNARPPTG